MDIEGLLLFKRNLLEKFREEATAEMQKKVADSEKQMREVEASKLKKIVNNKEASIYRNYKTVCDYIRANKMPSQQGRYMVYERDFYRANKNFLIRTDDLKSLQEITDDFAQHFECYDLATNKTFTLYEHK